MAWDWTGAFFFAGGVGPPVLALLANKWSPTFELLAHILLVLCFLGFGIYIFALLKLRE